MNDEPFYFLKYKLDICKSWKMLTLFDNYIDISHSHFNHQSSQPVSNSVNKTMSIYMGFHNRMIHSWLLSQNQAKLDKHFVYTQMNWG